MKTNRNLQAKGGLTLSTVPDCVVAGERVQGEGPHLLHRQHAEQEQQHPQRAAHQEAVRRSAHPGRGGVWAGAGQEQGEDEGACSKPNRAALPC